MGNYKYRVIGINTPITDTTEYTSYKDALKAAKGMASSCCCDVNILRCGDVYCRVSHAYYCSNGKFIKQKVIRY